MIKDEKLYQCAFCKKKFKSDKTFIRHKCEQQKRDESLRTVQGQAALSYYQEWMRLQQKRVPDIRAFLKSHTYKSFMRFAEYVKRTELPEPKEFIKLMIKQNYLPSMWHFPEVHTIYMNHMDNSVPPMKLVRITMFTLDDISNFYNCEIGDVFNYVYPGEVIDLVSKRKLSPWVLLPSAKFRGFLNKIHKTHPEHFAHLDSLIRASYWMKKFKTHPDVMKEIDKIIKETNL